MNKRHFKIDSLAPDGKDFSKIHLLATEISAEEYERILASPDSQGQADDDTGSDDAEACEIASGVFLSVDEDESESPGFWSWLRTYAP